MTDSLLPWGVLVLFIAWLVGAYNRLVRLRAQVMAASRALGDTLDHYSALVKEGCTGAAGRTQAELPPQPPGTSVALWAGVQAAQEQFDTCLRIARRHPLDAGKVAALRTALAVLHDAWKKLRDLSRDQPHLLSAECAERWTDNERVVIQQTTAFNGTVLAYNAAIAQFPALLLAHLFSFRAAGCL